MSTVHFRQTRHVLQRQSSAAEHHKSYILADIVFSHERFKYLNNIILT